MKKFLLGLVLSAGMSSMAFASSDVKLDNLKGLEKVANCTIVTRVSLVDSNGNSGGYKDYFTEGHGSQCDKALNYMVYKEETITLSGSFENNNDYKNH